MSVHYKFKSALEYDTVTFDGLHISVRDLKNAIIQQKRIGKNTDFDLQVTNAQTKEVYEDEETLIPKNTSLLIARIPLIATNKSKTWEGYGSDSVLPTRIDEIGPIATAVDLSSLDASEDDKIRAMMSQSTQDYDPSKSKKIPKYCYHDKTLYVNGLHRSYLKIRGANQVGIVPPNYRCYKCHQQGHWIKDCPLSQGSEPIEIKKSTGIPRSFMVPVDGPQVQGAMMTPNGSYAVPVLDHQTYTQKQQPPPPLQEEQPEIPEDLVCSICSGLLTDAVMIPCCGNSFCDECIRSCLLESEDHECPDCHERDISPGTLIPNRYLRNSVANFKNTTGYVKRPMFKPATVDLKQIEIRKEEEVVLAPESKETMEINKIENTEKTVISEADSTEPPKLTTNVDFSKDIDLSDLSKESPSKSSVSEGPPGVSPRRDKSPKHVSHRRNHSASNHNGGRSRRNSKDSSPRHHNTRHSPHFDPMPRIEERAGTPTVDEPGIGGSTIISTGGTYPSSTGSYTSGPPPGVLPPMIGLPPPHMQGPPPSYSTSQPPPGVFSQGPLPNFRLPPPGTNPTPPYISGQFNPGSRPMFDPSRPPVQGPPPSYSSYSSRSRGRDYGSSSRLRNRTPPGIIDDPLEAFNRMIREKDERERRNKQRRGRSYSRSSSRSYSRSPKRIRSRSPRRRNTRSRSRSFSISRSISRSFSPSPRNSPYRDYSPRLSSPRRRPPSRYRSPLRSPPRYRYKDPPVVERNRDRDYDRPSQRDRDRERERGYSRDRDYNYYDRERGRWGSSGVAPRPALDNYYPPPEVHPLQPLTNRYPPRDNYQPPYMNKNEPPHHIPSLLQTPIHMPPQRRFDDLLPPGTDQPPIPGEEIPPRYEERYPYDRPHVEMPTVKGRYSTEKDMREKDSEKRNYTREEKPRDEVSEKTKRYDRYSRSPPKVKNSPRKSRERERERHESPDRHRRRKRDDTPADRDRKDERYDRKRDVSDDEKLKKSKDKKKKREKKEQERKRRKERREQRKEHDKLKKEEKEKRNKDKEPVTDYDHKEDIERANSKDIDSEPQKEFKKELLTSVNRQSLERQYKTDVEEKTAKIEEKPDLYGDLLSEGVDTTIVKNYGKFQDFKDESTAPEKETKLEELIEEDKEEGEYPQESETSKDDDVLDIHANEAELKAELEKSEVLAPLPEKSKWEIEEDTTSAAIESAKFEGKVEKFGKVTNEVLKRAENAIFAKAINAIRPIEIKKISVDRAKLYSGEKEREKDKKFEEVEVRNIHITIPGSTFEEDLLPPGTEPVKVESEIQKPPPRLSVKERLGVKVDDLDRIVKVSYDRNRSRSLSPFSKRVREDRLHNERRVELDDRRHDRRYDRDRHHRNYRSNDSRGEVRRRDDYSRRDRDTHRSRRDDHRRDDKKDRSKSRGRDKEERGGGKRKRSRSSSGSKDHKEKDKHKKRDKKQKKEKQKKHRKDDDDKPKEDVKVEKADDDIKLKSATDRRKPTLDEANFEPDYDLDTESEKEDGKKDRKYAQALVSEDELKKRAKEEEKEKKESSSSDSSESSSEDEKKKKKHKKHKKKKSKRDSSSSSSSSESESSDDEKEKKRRKHKKKQKKRKKSKHK